MLAELFLAFGEYKSINVDCHISLVFLFLFADIFLLLRVYEIPCLVSPPSAQGYREGGIH